MTDYYEVINCSGIVDPDLPGNTRCPFYYDDWGWCALLNKIVIDEDALPSDCPLSNRDVSVSLKKT